MDEPEKEEEIKKKKESMMERLRVSKTGIGAEKSKEKLKHTSVSAPEEPLVSLKIRTLNSFNSLFISNFIKDFNKTEQ